MKINNDILNHYHITDTKISGFFFEYRWLSNYHLCTIPYEGIVYPSSEHAYQAAKTLDVSIREAMVSLPEPKFAKRMGKKLKDLRPDWEDVKLNIMRDILKIKFSIPELKQKLLETHPKELIEECWWHDQFWAICSCQKCNGVGQNNLGKLLMEIRDAEIK